MLGGLMPVLLEQPLRQGLARVSPVQFQLPAPCLAAIAEAFIESNMTQQVSAKLKLPAITVTKSLYMSLFAKLIDDETKCDRYWRDPSSGYRSRYLIDQFSLTC